MQRCEIQLASFTASFREQRRQTAPATVHTVMVCFCEITDRLNTTIGSLSLLNVVT